MNKTISVEKKWKTVDDLDAELCNRVTRFLNLQHPGAYLDLDVEVQHGAVRLTGRVRSFYERQVAVAGCGHVSGVLALIDDITVPSWEYADEFPFDV